MTHLSASLPQHMPMTSTFTSVHEELTRPTASLPQHMPRTTTFTSNHEETTPTFPQHMPMTSTFTSIHEDLTRPTASLPQHMPMTSTFTSVHEEPAHPTASLSQHMPVSSCFEALPLNSPAWEGYSHTVFRPHSTPCGYEAVSQSLSLSSTDSIDTIHGQPAVCPRPSMILSRHSHSSVGLTPSVPGSYHSAQVSGPLIAELPEPLEC
ncbi:hypothetical protein CYMTET_47782 [Cymbomonas tetramitiformis]|uniref:Uncharacterized protein n=1 Tax=Cymbomonas tetramitiformis TaxID=36881 RepID=A0AAE0BVB3_9CHLO|nr:hypothetical protein CYMTET_47782 [Cymbomonas tetramitiformis]